MKETAPVGSATERVGRYQLLEPIGVGPCGAVSRGKVFGVAGFERQFAVKRFHPEVTATSAMAAALSAGARAYGGLEHPRIARMSEFGVAQGQTFTAVELVPGLDTMRLVAEARLGGTTLAVGGALALISQAARAVGYAHGRGLSHLGLAPTNVIVTAEGDVKVTDFGILAATLPPRPIDVARLANRIAYLAPEQLTGEATSAATDVYALGVIAYELVTGQRTFRGETPTQIAQAILAGPPPEPALPRPIVRVLQRCLARSPFERFPDARALADALDAALRVAPVPGTRKDIGSQVKDTLDRLSALNDGSMSGMVAMHVGTGPVRRLEPLEVDEDDVLASARRSQEAIEIATSEFVRPDLPVAGPAPMVGPARNSDAGVTQPDLPRPMTTVPGLAPPPIPVPPGLAPPPMPPLPPSPGAPNTLLGMSTRRPPSVPPPMRVPNIRPQSVPAVPPVPSARPGTESDVEPEIIEMFADSPPTLVPAEPPPRPSDQGLDFEPPTREMSVGLTKALGEVSMRPTEELSPIVKEVVANDQARRAVSASMPVVPRGAQTLFGTPPPALPIKRDGATPPSIPAQRPATGQLPAQRADSAPGQRPGTGPLPAQRADSASGRADTAVSPGRADSVPPFRLDTASMPAVEVESTRGPRASTTDLVPRPPLSPAAQEWLAAPPTVAPKLRASRTPWIIAAIVLVAGLGFGGWQLWRSFGYDEPVVAVTADAGRATRPDAAQFAAAAIDAGAADKRADGGLGVASGKPDAAVASVATVADAAIAIAAVAADAGKLAVASDAAPADAAKLAVVADAAKLAVVADAAKLAVVVDAGVAPADAAAPVAVASGGALSIDSTPPGAHVFFDGADHGVTPAKLPGITGRHTVALLLAGHELYVAQVDGTGTFTIPLKAVVPSTGPAGIKVLKCKDTNRYYVTVDGKPTGMTCPTERIDCALGPHTVEVYDALLATSRKWEITITDTRLSYRVRIEP